MLIVHSGQLMFMKLLKVDISLTSSKPGQQELNSQSVLIVEKLEPVFSAHPQDQDAWLHIISLVHIEIKKWRSLLKMEKKLYAIHAAKVREVFSLVYPKNMLILKEDSKLQRISNHGI